MPHFVAKQWRQIYDDNKELNQDGDRDIGPALGTIRIVNSGNANEESKVILSLNNEATSDLPRDYQMKRSAPGPEMIAFSESKSAWACEGIIDQRFEANAQGRQLDEAYRKLSRERNQQASVKTRTIQRLTGTQLTNIRVPKGADAVVMKRKADDKRVAMPKDNLMPYLFKLFEKKEHWRFSNLQEETKQPVQHLKSVLSEIAQQNKFGPYRDLWSLKKEFRVSTEDNEQK